MQSGAIAEKIGALIETLNRYLVGYGELVRLVAIALLSEGHILIEGPPGTAKTLIARLTARLIGGSFKRIQMLPDTLPSDIVGAYVFDVRSGEWVVRKGPIFANVVLVDELNRAPPKTQAALLEAMQERRVTIEGESFELPRPFLVLASQVPYGYEEGVYPLPHTLRDRFAYSYRLAYMGVEEEVEIIKRADEIEAVEHELEPILSTRELLEARRILSEIYVSDKILRYIAEIVVRLRRSREVLLGPSPRASIWLYRGSRALALLEGMDYVTPDHVKWLAPFVARHRIIVNPELEAEGVSPEDVISRVLSEVEVPKI